MAIARDVEDDQERRDGEKKLMKATWGEVLRRAFVWMLIRLLLFGGLIGIAAVGAWAFMALEQPNELSLCYLASNAYVPLEESTVEQIWNIGQSYFLDVANGNQENTLAQITSVVDDFTSNLNGLNNFDGRNCSEMGTANGVQFKWNTFGALLFATTIFTTVGYGNIAPVTYWGRILCFAYGMIGIPYMLWCLSIMGELMADIFNFVYVNLCCLGCCARRGRRLKRAKILEENKKRIREEMMTQKLSASGIPTSWKELYETREDEMNKAAKALMVDVDEEEEDDDEIAIPLSVTLMIVFSYVTFGTVLFGVWEDWDTVAAAYFCFVTISTIGFGDIVPGTAGKSVTAATDTVKLTVCAIYSVIGMAIISMAFNLIQENISKKAKAIKDKIDNLKVISDDQGSTGEDQDGLSNAGAIPQATFPMMSGAPGLGHAAFPFGLPQTPESWPEQSDAPIESLTASSSSSSQSPTETPSPRESDTAPKSATSPRRGQTTGGDQDDVPKPEISETSFTEQSHHAP